MPMSEKKTILSIFPSFLWYLSHASPVRGSREEEKEEQRPDCPHLEKHSLGVLETGSSNRELGRDADKGLYQVEEEAGSSLCLHQSLLWHQRLRERLVWTWCPNTPAAGDTQRLSHVAHGHQLFPQIKAKVTATNKRANVFVVPAQTLFHYNHLGVQSSTQVPAGLSVRLICSFACKAPKTLGDPSSIGLKTEG